MLRKNVDEDHNNIMNINPETPMNKCDLELDMIMDNGQKESEE